MINIMYNTLPPKLLPSTSPSPHYHPHSSSPYLSPPLPSSWHDWLGLVIFSHQIFGQKQVLHFEEFRLVRWYIDYSKVLHTVCSIVHRSTGVETYFSRTCKEYVTPVCQIKGIWLLKTTLKLCYFSITYCYIPIPFSDNSYIYVYNNICMLWKRSLKRL